MKWSKGAAVSKTTVGGGLIIPIEMGGMKEMKEFN